MDFVSMKTVIGLLTAGTLLPPQMRQQCKDFVGETHLISNQARARRMNALKRLKGTGFGDKVRMYILSPVGAAHTYVHAKIFIIDDEFAVIGSANCNRRSYTHDSECVAGIADRDEYQVIGHNLAHRLRINLWAEHLFPVDPTVAKSEQDKHREKTYAELADGVASAVHWLHLPDRARVTAYDEKSPIDISGSQFMWDYFIDPSGE
jgi:phosphatidylserine/phosphatidylglycerophosphate/cardiolipin synthase-like enzyme